MTRRDCGADSAVKQGGETAEASKKTVIRYLLRLLAAVIFFTVLSYLTKTSDNTRVGRLHFDNATATQHIETLREEYDQLQQKYDELLTLYNNLKDETGTEVSKND